MGDRHRRGEEAAEVHQGHLLRLAAPPPRLQVLQARTADRKRLLADQVRICFKQNYDPPPPLLFKPAVFSPWI